MSTPVSSANAPIDLVAEARAIPRKPNGDPCSVVQAAHARPDLAAAIVAVVHDPLSLPANASLILGRYDLKVSELTIGRHRRGLCKQCPYYELIGTLPKAGA